MPELVYGCWAGGDLVATGTRRQCELAAEDVRGDFPDVDVGVDVLTGCVRRLGCPEWVPDCVTPEGTTCPRL